MFTMGCTKKPYVGLINMWEIVVQNYSIVWQEHIIMSNKSVSFTRTALSIYMRVNIASWIGAKTTLAKFKTPLIPIYFQKLQAIGGQKIKFIEDLQIRISPA